VIEHGVGTAPAPAFVAACHLATGGNPLLVAELVEGLSSEGVRPDDDHLALIEELGPASVTRSVFLRLRRMGADATTLAQALAVLGDGAGMATLAGLAGMDLDRAARALAALARAEIVRTVPPLGFVHPLVAAAIYHDLPPGERELRHLRAAELLVAAGAPVEQVAGHLLLAPGRGEAWVVEQLVQAASAAARKGAPDSAAAYLERALAEPPAPARRTDLALALGRVETPIRGAAAVEHLRSAYPLLTDPVQRAGAAQLLGTALLFSGNGDEAVQIVRDAAAALPDHLLDQRRQLEAFALFCHLFGRGGPGDLRDLEGCRTLPAGAGLGAKMLAAIAAQVWMHAGGPCDAVSALSLAALADGELIAADSGWAATFAITNLTYADREEADRWWDVARADAYSRGSLLNIAAITLWEGNALHRRGELADAEQSLRTCVGAVQDWGFRDQMGQLFCDAHLAAVLRDRGNVAGARLALSRPPVAGRVDEAARRWCGSHIEQLLADGSYEAAVAAADDYAGRFDHHVPNPMDVPWRSLKALALDHLGRRDEAQELVWTELELAQSWGAPATVARTLRALGTVEGHDGLKRLEEAVAVVAGSPGRLEHAKALAAMGAALRRARRPSDARGPLRQALELATVCGAEALAHRTRNELYAAGGRPRRTALTGPASLTAGERRVVVLVAEGLTNREVGEALYVTPKTIAMHLSNAYRKLGVTSRHQLPAALAPIAEVPSP